MDQIHGEAAYSYAHCRPRKEDYHEALHVVVVVLHVVIHRAVVLVGNCHQREVVPELVSARRAEKSVENWATETQWQKKIPAVDQSEERAE